MKPTDKSYKNAGREREALLAELGQEEYDKQRKEAKKKREKARQVRPNRTDQRREWKAAGAVPKRRGLRVPPLHPLSMVAVAERRHQDRLAAEAAELEAQLNEKEIAA